MYSRTGSGYSAFKQCLTEHGSHAEKQFSELNPSGGDRWRRRDALVTRRGDLGDPSRRPRERVENLITKYHPLHGLSEHSRPGCLGCGGAPTQVRYDMDRRKFVVGLGALASGSAAAVGTGAFSSVEAERSLSVQIADDSDAYLQFDTDLGNAPDNNYEYAEINDDGELEVEFAENDAGGLGVNPNAVTVFEDVFAIKNRGTEPMEISVEFGGDVEQNIGLTMYYVGDDPDQNNFVSPNSESRSWNTDVGAQMRVAIRVDTTNTPSDKANLPESFGGTVTFSAEAQ